jgi:hypothetical protein
LSNFEDFEFRLRAKDIELKRMNDFASAYGKFDFNGGHGDVVIEAQAKKAKLTGYIKPLLGMSTCSTGSRTSKTRTRDLPLHLGGHCRWLRDRAEKPGKNQFATRVELSGSVHQQDVSAFQAFLQILRNGFIQAFNARYERPKPDAG